jgi:hypothetical protein
VFRGLGTGQKASLVENWFVHVLRRVTVRDTDYCARCMHFEG